MCYKLQYFFCSIFFCFFQEDKNDSNLTSVYSGSSSPLAEVDEKLIQSKLENLPLPAGWKTKLDEETGLTCYINLVTGAKVSL